MNSTEHEFPDPKKYLIGFIQADIETSGYKHKFFITEKLALRKLSSSPHHSQFSDCDSSGGKRSEIINKSYTPNARNRTSSPNNILKDLQSLYRKDVLPDRKLLYGNGLGGGKKLPVAFRKFRDLPEQRSPFIRHEEKGRMNNLKKVSPPSNKESQKKAANFNLTMKNCSPKRSKHRNEEEIKMKVDDLILSYIKKGMILKTKS